MIKITVEEHRDGWSASIGMHNTVIAQTRIKQRTAYKAFMWAKKQLDELKAEHEEMERIIDEEINKRILK